MDAWVQWFFVLVTIVGALMHLEGRITRIEQELMDDSRVHAEEVGRLDMLEKELRELHKPRR